MGKNFNTVKTEVKHWRNFTFNGQVYDLRLGILLCLLWLLLVSWVSAFLNISLTGFLRLGIFPMKATIIREKSALNSFGLSWMPE
jgi:hypothetical protein